MMESKCTEVDARGSTNVLCQQMRFPVPTDLITIEGVSSAVGR